jgi:hypothetical protein
MVHEAVDFVVHVCSLQSGVDRLQGSVHFVVILTFKLQDAKIVVIAGPQVHVLLKLAVWHMF